MHPRTTAALAALTKCTQEISRVRRRIKRLEKHKLPFYWSVSPHTMQLAAALESSLQEDIKDLQEMSR